jgi:hypothetical protein
MLGRLRFLDSKGKISACFQTAKTCFEKIKYHSASISVENLPAHQLHLELVQD